MKTTRGFTLVELLITLTIIALVLSFGVPMFQDVIRDNRLVSQANAFMGDLNLARSTAVKYQRDASICASTDYDSATPSCTGGTNWAAGWIVWVDRNRDNSVDAGEIVKVREPFASGTSFSSTAAGQLTFDSRGFISAAETLTLCDDRTGETGRRITLTASGRPNISNFNCS